MTDSDDDFVEDILISNESDDDMHENNNDQNATDSKILQEHKISDIKL